jgi:hypothetical protein
MNKWSILFVIALALVSCAKSDRKSDPVSPGLDPPDRLGQFFDSARLVFGSPGTCTDADVATVVNGPGTANPGTAWADGNGNRWSVATGLRRMDEYYLVTWRFLPDEQGEIQTALQIGVAVYECRLIKVDACYFAEDAYSPSTPFVEASIIFQHRDPVGGDWDISVWRVG